jgi:hypothetical protein
MGNLAIEQLAENQAAPEVTVNDAALALEQALTESYDIDLTSGNASVSVLNFQRAMLFYAHGVGTAGRTVTLTPTVPQRSLVLFECAAANTDNVSLICGSTTVTLKPGRLYAVQTDGTANGLVAHDVGGADVPNDFHIFLPGLTSASQLAYRLVVTRPFTLPINLGGSNITSVGAATGSSTWTLKKNGSSIGTAVWSAAGTTAAKTFAAAVSFAAGDIFTIVGPVSPDATLSDISFDLFGTR